MDREDILKHLNTLADGISDLENYTESLNALKDFINNSNNSDNSDNIDYREKYEKLRTDYLMRFSDLTNNVNNTPILEEDFNKPDEDFKADDLKRIDWDGEND